MSKTGFSLRIGCILTVEIFATSVLLKWRRNDKTSPIMYVYLSPNQSLFLTGICHGPNDINFNLLKVIGNRKMNMRPLCRSSRGDSIASGELLLFPSQQENCSAPEHATLQIFFYSCIN